jgi:glyoxylase-like metal-dependent hydrolase (beta-lactamase superfamily II)
MTLEGTNTYLVLGGRDAIVIDPGPDDPAHVDTIMASARNHRANIVAIAVTHGHPDHAPGAAQLGKRTGARIYAHAAASFPFDVAVAEGDRIEAGDAALGVIEAPGHARDHVVFELASEAALFTGDVVIGRGTVVIAPPNGDMRVYQATLARLRRDYEHAKTIYGGHGEAIPDPRAKLDEYIAHREAREREIVGAIAIEQTIPEIVAHVYRNVAPLLWPAAARQVLAYLIALESEGAVQVRRLEREPSAQERAILDPDLSQLVDRAEAAVAAAELGFERKLTHVDAYRLSDR